MYQKDAANTALIEQLDAMVPNLDIDSLKQAPITVPVLELQLELGLFLAHSVRTL